MPCISAIRARIARRTVHSATHPATVNEGNSPPVRGDPDGYSSPFRVGVFGCGANYRRRLRIPSLTLASLNLHSGSSHGRRLDRVSGQCASSNMSFVRNQDELKAREPAMARNRVQFQKGYSLTQFMDEYGTEEKCTEAVFRWRWPNGFVCPRCEHTGHWRHQSRALYQCRRCRHQVSLTAGTILRARSCPFARGSWRCTC